MGAGESQWEPSFLYRNTTPVESPFTSRKDYHLTTDLADEAILDGEARPRGAKELSDVPNEEHRELDELHGALTCHLDRSLVAGIGVAEDPHRWIGGQNALEPPSRRLGSVGDDDLTRVKRIADADTASVMHAHPGRAAGCIEESVQNRPVGNGVRAIFHPFGLAIRRGDRATVEMVATDYHGSLELAPGYERVEDETHLRALTVGEPANPGR